MTMAMIKVKPDNKSFNCLLLAIFYRRQWKGLGPDAIK
jgi:hypothetical protein